MQNPPSPPESMSAKKFVENEWREINRMIWDAVPYEHRVNMLEEYLTTRKTDVEQLSLPGPYNWLSDLISAELVHKFHKDWIKRNEKDRDDRVQYWKDLAKRSQEFLEKVSLGGFNTIILLHGAVAVGALNILSKKSGEMTDGAIYAARFGLLAALIGILLAAFGMLTFFHFLTAISNTVSAHLVGPQRFRKVRAIGRYWPKTYKKTAAMGDRLIYVSIFWFAIYCVIAYLILVQN
jgi:hypothetical protein